MSNEEVPEWVNDEIHFMSDEAHDEICRRQIEKDAKICDEGAFILGMQCGVCAKAIRNQGKE